MLTAEKLTSVPTSTDMWGALAQAPGVRMSGFDVGGSHKIQSDRLRRIRHHRAGADDH